MAACQPPASPPSRRSGWNASDSAVKNDMKSPTLRSPRVTCAPPSARTPTNPSPVTMSISAGISAFIALILVSRWRSPSTIARKRPDW